MSLYSPTYSRLADALLGAGVRPFDGFRPPVDMRPSYWYGSVFAMSHADLATILLQQARRDAADGEDPWVLEAGSFIGNSAVVWASTMRALHIRSAVLCIDTWLGDLIMWEKRGKMLGKPGADGTPRLFEQFMLNVAGKNASADVLPLRMPALLGLQYVRRHVEQVCAWHARACPPCMHTHVHPADPSSRHVEQEGLPPPSIIYVDTAHTYPETIFELEAAWALLRPGGFLTGDDYTHYYPPVQQAVNEWVASKPAGAFEPPALWAAKWHPEPRTMLRSQCSRCSVHHSSHCTVCAAGGTTSSAIGSCASSSRATRRTPRASTRSRPCSSASPASGSCASRRPAVRRPRRPPRRRRGSRLA